MLVYETGPKSSSRAALVLGPALAIVVLGLIGSAPMPQDPAYHQFADQRTFYGVPHFWNVLSNVPFAVVGLLGCWWILRYGGTRPAFEESHERVAYVIFFAGELLTCFGSGYYHSGPSNETLVWDRFVFSLMLTSMFAIVVTEFVDRRLGRFMLAPIVSLGLVSVLYWWYTETAGRGDVRIYALVQFYPIVAMPVIFLLCKSRYTHARLFALMWVFYAIAKAAETYDREILAWSGLVSGHTVKHFVAAAASYVPLYALQRRTPLAAGILPPSMTARAVIDVPSTTRRRADAHVRSRLTARHWGVIITAFYAVVVLALLCRECY